LDKNEEIKAQINQKVSKLRGKTLYCNSGKGLPKTTLTSGGARNGRQRKGRSNLKRKNLKMKIFIKKESEVTRI